MKVKQINTQCSGKVNEGLVLREKKEGNESRMSRIRGE